METRANYVVVGVFTLVVIMAAFVFVYWIARVDTGVNTGRLDVVIEGSVTGLGVGSAVKFNGIDVGKVTRLRFDPMNPKVVVAQTQVNRNLPITSSTKATLGFTGLTGIAYIEFEGGDVVQDNVFEQAAPGEVPTVSADPSAVNNLITTAQDIFDRTNRVLAELEGFVADVRTPLSNTLTNASQFSEALRDNADSVDEFLEGIGSVGQALADVGAKLDGTIEGVERLLAAVDPQEVDNIVGNVEQFTAGLSDVSQQFQDVATRVSGVMDELGDVGGRVDGAFDRVDEILAAVPEEDLRQALSNLGGISEDVRRASEQLASLGAIIGGRGEQIEGIIDRAATITENADTFMANASGASEQFNSTVASAQSLLSGFEGLGERANAAVDRVQELVAAIPPEELNRAVTNIGSVSEDVRQASRQIASVAETISGRSEEIESVIDRAASITQNADSFMANANAVSEEFNATVASAQALLGEFEGVGARTNAAFDRIDALLAAMPPEELNRAVNNVSTISSDVRAAIAEVRAMTEGLGERNQDIQQVLDRIDRITGNAETFAANASNASNDFQRLSSSATSLMESLQGVGARVETSFDRVDALLEAVPAEDVRAAVEEIRQAGEYARTSLQEVQRATAGIGERQEDIQTVITNASEMAERLNAASVRVDGILAKVDNMLTSEEGESIVAEARETLRAFRKVAETLDTRVNAVSSGLQRFSDQGLRDVQNLINQTSRSVQRIERAITDLESNPEQLLFGGEENVKTYNGRTRR